MKILKNSKALSPVVASIILIAVTVAVSIAVAAWMGALSFNFMGTEQLSYTNYAWGTSNAYMNFTVKNTGSSDLSIQEVRVDGNTPDGLSPALTTPHLLAKGSSVTFMVTDTFSSGIQYEFTTITAKGNIFGPYIKAAP
jgi:flagellin-like protein